jgi:hypothetical protein
MRRRHRRWLRPIVILERDVEDRADAFRLRQTGDQKGEEGNANRFGHQTNPRLARRLRVTAHTRATAACGLEVVNSLLLVRDFKISVWCVSVAQASRDIDVHENFLRNWV